MFLKITTPAGIKIAIAAATAHVSNHFAAAAADKVSVTFRHPTPAECAQIDWKAAAEQGVIPAESASSLPLVVETLNKETAETSLAIYHFGSEADARKFVSGKFNELAGITIEEMKDLEALKFMREHNVDMSDVLEIAAPVKPEGTGKRGRPSNADRAAREAAAAETAGKDETGADIPGM